MLSLRHTNFWNWKDLRIHWTSILSFRRKDFVSERETTSSRSHSQSMEEPGQPRPGNQMLLSNLRAVCFLTTCSIPGLTLHPGAQGHMTILFFKTEATSGWRREEMISFSNSFLTSEFMVNIFISYTRVSATQLKINFARNLGKLRRTWQMGVIFNLSKKPPRGVVWQAPIKHSVNG